MRIHIAFADYYTEFGTSTWRCLIPAEGLRRAGHDVTVSHIHDIERYDADSYLIERNLFDPKVFTAIENLQAKGKRIVVTFDDHYVIMPADCPSKKTWNFDNVKKFCDALGEVDCAIVPSKLLAEDYRPFCKEMRYIPNCADPSLYCGKKKRHDTINILWGGNMTHLQGMKRVAFLPALEKLCKRHHNVRVIACGDQLSRDTFARYIPAPQLMLASWVPLPEWAKFVGTHADIIICPLGGEYDRRRSWVKAIDSIMYGIPMIASDLEPYWETGAKLVENTEKAWYNCLCDMALSDFVRTQTARKMRRSLGDVTIDAHIREYEEVLQCKNFPSTL